LNFAIASSGIQNPILRNIRQLIRSQCMKSMENIMKY